MAFTADPLRQKRPGFVGLGKSNGDLSAFPEEAGQPAMAPKEGGKEPPGDEQQARNQAQAPAQR